MKNSTNIYDEAIIEFRELLSAGQYKCISEETLSVISSYISDLELQNAMLEKELMEYELNYGELNQYSIKRGR